MTQAREEANRKLRDALSGLLTADQQEDIYGSAFLPPAKAGAEGQAVFASRDAKQVWATSAVEETYLNVKASHELVLGDSVGVSVTRGNIYRVKLAHDDKALLKYPAQAGTPADDGQGPMVINLKGISMQAAMDEVVLQQEDLYDDIDSRARVNVACVKQPRLAYGDVSIASAKLMAKAQWLDSQNAFPALAACDYARLTLSSADPIGPDLQGEISLGVNATGSEQSRKFFDAKGMQGYEHILMPPKVKGHMSSGKTSRLEYTRGAGQLTLNEVDCVKNITYTKDFHFASHCTKDHDWEVKTQSKCINSFTAAVLASEVTAASMPMELHVLRANHQLGPVKSSLNVFGLDFSSNESIALQNKLGCLLSKGGVLVQSMASKAYAGVLRLHDSVLSIESAQAQVQAAPIAITSGGVVLDQMDASVRSSTIEVSTANLTMVMDGGGAQPSPPPPMAPGPAVAVKASRAAAVGAEVTEDGAEVVGQFADEGFMAGKDPFDGVGSAPGPRAGRGAGAGGGAGAGAGGGAGAGAGGTADGAEAARLVQEAADAAGPAGGTGPGSGGGTGTGAGAGDGAGAGAGAGAGRAP